MKKTNTLIATLLLGCGFVSASFADTPPLSIEYKLYSAYLPNACPTELTTAFDNKEYLTLTFKDNRPENLVLSSATIHGVTTPAEAQLSKHEEQQDAYMFKDSATLTIDGKQFSIHQVWVENNQAAFYVGESTNSSCLIMNVAEAETNFLAQP